jgi:hypothetical protein
MKPELAMRLFSRQTLTSPQAERQINALGSFRNGLFCPDKCSAFEPISNGFTPPNITEPVRWLSRPSGTFMYRQKSPAKVTGVMWNLSRPDLCDTDKSGRRTKLAPRHPQRLFSNYWTADFDGLWVKKVGLDTTLSFVSEMFAVSGSDFGLFTALEDLNRKNYLVRQVGNGQAMSYEGLDPAHGVPGLYWITLFSRSFASWLGIRKSITSSGLISEIPAGFMLRFSETPDSCQSEETLNVQKCLISELGERRFFDIHRPLRS